MRRFGLIGYPLSHSFSHQYFTEKFGREGVTDAEYEIFPLIDLSGFRVLIEAHPDLIGLNVTIPYKEKIIPFLDEVDASAIEIGAVNVLKRISSGRWKGYNSDVYGFERTLLSSADQTFWRGKSALIFGSGGACKAVRHVLNQLSVSYSVVSRGATELTYKTLTSGLVEKADLLVNCTPVGMYPNEQESLPVPYDAIHSGQVVIDLIYNPLETIFLKNAAHNGALSINGKMMLYAQAERAWEIWNEP